MRPAAELGPEDWAAIERDYTGFGLTLRDIERRHRVHIRSIYSRARAEGWPMRSKRVSWLGPRAGAARRLHDRLYRLIERGLDAAEGDAAGRDGEPAPEAAKELIGLLEKLVRLAERIAELDRRIAEDGGAVRDRGRAPLDDAGRAAVEDFLARHGIELPPLAGWGGRAAAGPERPA
jgi:hypothetical protein